MDLSLQSHGYMSIQQWWKVKKLVHNDMCLEYAGVLSETCDEQCAPVTYLESEICQVKEVLRWAKLSDRVPEVNVQHLKELSTWHVRQRFKIFLLA